MWEPIANIKPVMWRRYIVLRPNSEGDWEVAMWKTNSRWGRGDDIEFDRCHPQPYFGCPSESDDYDDALVENWPTHFIEVPEPPSGSE